MKDKCLLQADMETSTKQLYGEFKGFDKQDFTFGKVGTHKGIEVQYFIKTGDASRVMVKGIRTSIQFQKKA